MCVCAHASVYEEIGVHISALSVYSGRELMQKRQVAIFCHMQN